AARAARGAAALPARLGHRQRGAASRVGERRENPLLPVRKDAGAGAGRPGVIRTKDQFIAAVARPRLVTMFTSAGSEFAFILRMTWPRCAFTVISLIPSSPPTCLFRRPETTRTMTSRSRGVSDS